MTEKFALDGAFGYSATVDGDKFLVLAAAIVVNHAGKDLLTHTTLTSNKDAEVGRRHLDGFVDGHQQLRVVAYYIVSIFYCLDVQRCLYLKG